MTITRRKLLGWFAAAPVAASLPAAPTIVPLSGMSVNPPMAASGSLILADLAYDERLAGALHYRDEFIAAMDDGMEWLKGKTVYEEEFSVADAQWCAHD